MSTGQMVGQVNAASLISEVQTIADAEVASASASALAASVSAAAADSDAAAAQAAQTAAESARDAAIIQAGVYASEAVGRAAVADGVAFKVQGSGEIAAYEYRRVDAGSSTLIATYPSLAAMTAAQISATSAVEAALTPAVVQAIGRTPAAGTTMGAGVVLWHAVPSARRGYLSELRFYAAATGVLKIKVLSALSGSGTVDVVSSTSVTISSTGAVTLMAGVELPFLAVPQGGFVGVFSDAGYARGTYTGGVSTAPYFLSASDMAGSGISAGAMQFAAGLNYGYDIAAQDVSASKLEASLVRQTAPNISALVQQAVGYAAAGPGAGTLTTNATFWHPQPAARRGVVSSFSCYAATPGLVRLKVLSALSASGQVDVLSTYTLPIGNVGVNTFTSSNGLPYIEVPEGGYLAVFGGANPATVSYTGSITTEPYHFVSGELTGTNNNVGTLASAVRMDWTYTLDAYPVRASQLSTADRSKIDGAPTFSSVLEAIPSFNALPNGWVNGASSWLFAGGKASSGAVGNELRSGAYFGLSRRRIRWEFQITSASTELLFFTNPTEAAAFPRGSAIRLSTSANSIEIMTFYTGANTPTPLASTALGFTLSVGRRYVLEWEIVGRSLAVRVWDKSGSGSATASRTVNYYGYDVWPGTYGYDQGACLGSPGVKVNVGAADVYSFSHYGIGVRSPVVLLLGDSITGGLGVSDTQRFGELLDTMMGGGRVAISGVPSATMTGALVRLRAETLALRPKYVLIHLGTNADASFSGSLSAAVALVESLGGIAVVCTIPTDATRTATVNALGPSVIKVALDLALTTSGAGSGVLAPYYENTDAHGTPYNDGYHPNAAGHAAMATRIQLDAPEMFL